jgi:aconitate hydratase 2 / 2-methylisocitrate dehydratase
VVNPLAGELYRYLNFDQMTDFADEGRVISPEEEAKLLAASS